MKRVLKVLGIILLAIALLLAAGAGFLYYVVYHAPMVPKDYWADTQTGGPVEETYLAWGGRDVAYVEESAGAPANKYVICYPRDLAREQYPVVVIVNGTGVFANKARPLFSHLASWGFLVIGNYDGSTWSGASANQTLDHLLRLNEDPDSVFYQKVDTTRIGVTGHSQGGVGVFNAIRDGRYKCAVSISPTEEEMAALLQMPYDASETTIPIFLLAGTENDVISIEKLEGMYDSITAPKAMAVRTGQRHGEMLYAADGYVTAWFMWQLQDDGSAARAFLTDTPELLANSLYQNQRLELTGP